MANNFLYSDTLKNAMLEEIETGIQAGTGAPKLQVFAHTATPTIDAADGGTKLVEITLPDPSAFAAASGGSIAKTGTWTGTASATGTAKYFRIKTSAAGTGATTTVLQGSAGAATGTFDLEFDNASIANSQSVTINTFTVTAGN